MEEVKPTRKHLKVYCSKNHVIETDFNGTVSQAIAYYIGKTFNIGIDDDIMVYGHAIEIDGIRYNPSTHKYLSDADHEKNLALIEQRKEARAEHEGPRVGDFIYAWGAGKTANIYLRFTHDGHEAIQTTCLNQGDATTHGGFYSCKDGGTSYSGSLDSAIEKENCVLTDEVRNGAFWMFNRDYAEAHNAISFTMPCRVYRINPFDMPRKHSIRVVYHDGTTAPFERHGTSLAVVRSEIGLAHYVNGKRRVIEAVQFNDGCGTWQTHKRQVKAHYVTAQCSAVDHGAAKGLVLEMNYGSKWFTDGRREQLLEQCKTPAQWKALIEKEFS